jgi:hypothetical protein
VTLLLAPLVEFHLGVLISHLCTLRPYDIKIDILSLYRLVTVLLGKGSFTLKTGKVEPLFILEPQVSTLIIFESSTSRHDLASLS